MCFAMCPRLASAASFALFYNLIVLLHLFLQLLRPNGGTFCSNPWRNNFVEGKIWTNPPKRHKNEQNWRKFLARNAPQPKNGEIALQTPRTEFLRFG